MLRFKRYLCAALLLFMAIRVSAQQSSKPITLKELLSRVDQKAPTLITDSAAILIRQAQAAETRDNWLPNLRLNYQADIGSSNNTTGPYFRLLYYSGTSSGVSTIPM